jgi:hypothetical protein
VPRQTSIQITPEQDRQIAELKERGFGTLTGIFRIALDRLYREEVIIMPKVTEIVPSGWTQNQFFHSFTTAPNWLKHACSGFDATDYAIRQFGTGLEAIVRGSGNQTRGFLLEH